MPTLLRRLRRFVLGLLTAVMRATGREPLVAPTPIRRVVLDTMTPATRDQFAAQFALRASLAFAAHKATGRMVFIDQAEA